MANIHTVTQTQPLAVRNGACLLIKAGKEGLCREEFETLKPAHTARLTIKKPKVDLSIQNINVDSVNQTFTDSRSYIAVSSGSSNGYEEYFVEALSKLAPYLEDAEFYVEDEGHLLNSFKLSNGTVNCERIDLARDEEELDHLNIGKFFDYYTKRFPKEKETLFHLLKQEVLSNYQYVDPYEFMPFQRLIKAALQIHGDDKDLLSTYGVVLANCGQNQEAIEINKKLVTQVEKEAPEETYFLRTVYANIANDYCILKKFKTALKYAEKACQLTPTWGDYRAEEKKVYAYLGLKKFNQVLEICDIIIQRSTRTADLAYAFFNKACALIELKHFEEAAACIASAYTINPYYLPDQAKNDPDNVRLFQELCKQPNTQKIMGKWYDSIKT